jgi:hypothetical protein
VVAKVIPRNIGEADLVRRRVQERLAEFFHPLWGGPDKSGWEFGRDVFVSEIAKVIEDLDSVHHAEDIGMLPTSGIGVVDQVEVGEDYLVASGSHVITVVAA